MEERHSTFFVAMTLRVASYRESRLYLILIGCVIARDQVSMIRHLICKSTRPSAVSVPLILTGCNIFGVGPSKAELHNVVFKRHSEPMSLTVDDVPMLCQQFSLNVIQGLLMLAHSAEEARGALPVKKTTSHEPVNYESEVPADDHWTILPHSSFVGPTTPLVQHVSYSSLIHELRKFS